MISTLISLFVLAVNIFVLTYLSKLEQIGCKCAEGYKKTYIKVYAITSILNGIIVPILAILLLQMTMGDLASDPSIPSFGARILSFALFTWIVLFFVATIIYFTFAFQYIARLKNDDCGCSDGMMRDTWETLLKIRTGLTVATLLVGVFAVSQVGLLTSGMMGKENKKKKMDKKKSKKK